MWRNNQSVRAAIFCHSVQGFCAKNLACCNFYSSVHIQGVNWKFQSTDETILEVKDCQRPKAEPSKYRLCETVIRRGHGLSDFRHPQARGLGLFDWRMVLWPLPRCSCEYLPFIHMAVPTRYAFCNTFGKIWLVLTLITRKRFF